MTNIWYSSFSGFILSKNEGRNSNSNYVIDKLLKEKNNSSLAYD
jgi:hypothetical protein